ncbi:MAG: hypothetical protein ACTSRW_08825 [Candidatus Helarchaeota archaeon]
MSDSNFTRKDFKLYLSVILITLCIVTVIVVATVAWNLMTTRPYSYLAILDENGGDNFSPEMKVNDLFNATVVIGNFEYRSMLYRIWIKAGNVSTTTSSTSPATISVYNQTYFESCLSFYQTCRIDVQFNLTVIQNNTKLIFELWKYDVTSRVFTYSGSWVHVWINVTT